MAGEIRNAEAFTSLTPLAKWISVDGVVEWLSPDITQPTDAEIANEMTRLQAEYDALDYSRKRKTAYDKLNQLELMSDDSINGTTTHKDAILKVKSDYPKP